MLNQISRPIAVVLVVIVGVLTVRSGWSQPGAQKTETADAAPAKTAEAAAAVEIDSVLDQSTNMDLRDQTIEEIAACLKEKFRLPVVVDKAQFESLNFDPATKLSLRGMNTSLAAT